MSKVPFIGSKISLISKSDIRYEGTLHAINTVDSTVALENVQICGSEGRREGAQIPPSDNIYEYIVFRAADIKDLTVKDTEKTPSMVDPAIVSMPTRKVPQSSQSSSSLSSVSTPAGKPVVPSTAATTTSDLTSLSKPTSPPQTSRLDNILVSRSNVAAAAQPAPANVPVPQKAVQPATLTSAPSSNMPKSSGIETSVEALKALSLNQPDNRKPARTDSGVMPQYNNHHRDSDLKPNVQMPQGSHTFNGDYAKNAMGKPHFRGNAAHQPQQHPHRRYSHSKGVQIPKSEFDFESSNAKFDKERVAEEAPDALTSLTSASNKDKEEKGSYYEKRSFFDNISCETKDALESAGDRKDHRIRNAEEAKLNVETFGQSSLHGYSRGGYYSHRGRGYHHNYYRGGNGGEGYKNNYNHYPQNHYYRGGYRSYSSRGGHQQYNHKPMSRRGHDREGSEQEV